MLSIRTLYSISLVFLVYATIFAQDKWKAAYQPETDDWKNVDQHFIFNSGSEPETLDPHQTTAVDSSRLVSAMFEGLMEADPKTLEPRPACAESYTVSDDGLTYRFAIRAGLKWSDGTPLTSQDFLKSFERALSPEAAASYASLYYYIKGAEAFHTKGGSFNNVGVSAPGPESLVINLRTPCPFFNQLLTMPVFMPVPMHVVKHHGQAWTKCENVVGNGPFILKERRFRDRLIFEKNPLYRDASFVKLNKVTALCIDDQNTAYKLFLNGKMHWQTAVPQNRIDEIKRQPDYYVYEYFGTYFYRFNVTKKPFDNANIRKAFLLATNRKSITDELLKGGQTPSSIYCPEVAGYSPGNGLGYDVIKARELMAEAGYPDGKGFPVVELSYNTNEAHKMIAEALAQQWSRNLGIKVTTRNLEWKIFLNDMKNLKYTMARSAWIGDYSDPSTFYDCFHSTSGNNRTGWSSKEYDELLAKSQLERDQKKRFEIFSRMEEILVKEQCPILPIYRYVDQGLLAETVLGWYPNIRSAHPLHFIWLEP